MKSIRSKILLIIGGIIILAMVLSGLFVNQLTSKTVSESENYILSGTTEKIVANVNTYFQKYIAVAQQMSRDQYVKELVSSGADASNVMQSPYFNKVHTMMAESAASDPNGLASYMVASVDGKFGFNEGDWLSSFDLADKPYGFNSPESLKKGLIISEPYQDAVTGGMVVTIATPIYSNNGAYIGVVASDLQVTAVNEMVTNAKSSYQTGYQMLVSDTNSVLAHRDDGSVLKSIDEIGISAELTEAIKNGTTNVVKFDDNGVPSYGCVGVADYTGWKVVTVVPEKEYMGAVASTSRTLLVLYAVALVVLFAAIFAVSSGIVAPLRKLTGVTEELARGNLNAEIDIRTKDEVGQLANSMRDLTARLHTYIVYIEEVSQALTEFGKGNLNIELNQAYDGEFAQLKDAMLRTAAVFRKTIGEILHISDQVSSGSDQMASGAQMLAQGATEQASSIEELSATIQEISNNVNQNAESAKNAAQQVQSVGDTADKSNAQMKEMIDAIREINEKSAEIGKIIKTIDDIAFQTNILALNAAVEAARAGEAGKGFAVVADEVRNLASKSAEAAKTTTTLIEDSVHAVENGTRIADETGQMLSEVLEGVNQTVGLISDISNASAAQATTISQILLGVEQISAVVQTNSATAEESSASSEELASQATMLKDVSSQFKI